ncbi:hypothetical protein SRABI106_03950 [Rahnella aquatilis]|nr:hypothetical protein SRABI106_03950 [Rahnella aquatilis]
MACGNHYSCITHLADIFCINLFGCERQLGDHVRVCTQKINHRAVWQADKGRVVRAFFQRAEVGSFKVQTQCLVRILFQIGAHHADTVFHVVVATGNQRR